MEKVGVDDDDSRLLEMGLDWFSAVGLLTQPKARQRRVRGGVLTLTELI